ncbi:bifunctional UDP-N-acetylglucosamine diphosphorylase/glucosamine-1-phosphate N-acetyltransferase GlmU [Halocynthiibacter namhaensis]|uniref:bifunctional UDP-N-acetylglucosamine diphosphorylase/glucosamine-1-phosphate N-acetyltransferase GlmU n=1 Tax=Halocynthiibacter namhaensis TaxID=1290553 RepID=UPI000578E6B4|nr:bifunctional UDP-N-acetylglucosamine diphosphorylase/glucosamine-1-phosphate N-acetyltransferase GlmU [Halocynthiibacter namhaensis]
MSADKNTALIILAAGRGTRMNSELPKVLHPLGGTPLVVHAMDSAALAEPTRTIIVAGHGADAVTKAVQEYDETTEVVLQEEQLGTGHAVMQAREALAGFDGNVLVLFGDTPFISKTTIEALLEARTHNDVVLLGMDCVDPKRYGRLITDGDSLERVVEYKDAAPFERRITLCNGGIVAADAKLLFELLDAVSNDNASGEYYLPDVVQLARQRGLNAGFVTCEESETQGINTRADLAIAEKLFQDMKRAEVMDNGVTLTAPETVFFCYDTYIGGDTLIEPNVIFGPGVTVENDAHIRAFSHLEGCHVSRGAQVGPYARLRPGAELAEFTRIGNFVEVKNAQILEGAKVNHLSYIGDAEIGKGTNIGAGTITCNYDGVMKHKTTIGEGAFIGSNTMLVAPVTIGDEAMTASGSVITSDVEAGALAVARARQDVKPGLARRLMDKLKATKAKLDGKV